MSIVTRTAKRSPRLIAIGLLMTLVSSIVFASKWDSLNTFARENFGASSLARSVETTRSNKSQLTGNLLNPESLLVPGTCDTAGPIEVEGSIVGTTPTAYATLGAAFAAINAGTHTGDITIDVCGDTSEGAASAVLNASGSGGASYTSIVMTPAGSAARTISGAVAGHLVDLNGADNVTINGLNSGGNALTISNTSTASAASTIRLVGDASNNIITNLGIQGSTGAVTSGLGVVYFAGAATTGNNNNTISNNNIGPAGSSTPLNGIYSLGTAGTPNSNNTISGNNIFDYFNAGLATNGIFLSGATGQTGWTITNNRLFQTATRVYTTSNTHNGIQIQGGSGYTITGNTIGYANASGTGTTNMVGNTVALTGTFPSSYTTTGTANATRYQAMNLTFTAAGANSTIDNNTIAGFALYTSSGATTTTGIFCGICVAAGNATIGGTGNTIGTPTGSIYAAMTTSGGVISGIYTTSANTVGILNNTIQNIDSMGTTASISGSIKGIESAGTVGPVTITGNTVGNATNPNLRMGNLTTGANLSNVGTTFGTASGIGNFVGIVNNNTSTAVTIGNASAGNTVRNAALNTSSTSTSTFVRGIYAVSGVNSIVNNSVSNLTSASASTSTGTTASINGIIVAGSTGGQLLSRNTVQNLSNTAATAAVQLNGIYWSNSSTTTSLIERNLVQNLTIASTGSALLNGAYLFNGSWSFRNNMILLGTDSGGTSLTSGTLSIAGIRTDTTSSQTDNFFNNSVLIKGTGVTTGTVNTFAFTQLTTTTLTDIRNNILVNNRSNATGTGKHYNIGLNSLTAVTTNYNLYFQSGTGAVQGVIGTTDSANFGAWQTATSQEAASSFADPLFVSATDLHLTSGSPARDTGVVIASVTNDFDGKSRPGANALYDRGADEFDGIAPVANDIQATAFIDPTNGGVKLAGASFSPQASFTNNGTSSQTSVNVRYRICADVACATVLYNNTQVIASINSGATTTVTFAPTSIATGGTYYIRAKAELGTDSIPANDEISGTLVIATPLSGTYTVGAGGAYSSLTNSGGLFQAINNLGTTSNLTIEIVSDLTGETGANGLNEVAGGYSVTIKPSGAARTITSTTTATGLIILNGADNVTIDGSLSGGTDRSLTLISANSTTSGTTVVALFSAGIGAGAVNNTIKNTIIQNGTRFEASTTSFNFGIYAGSGASAASADIDNLTIQNNLIQRCQYGIQAFGFTGGALDNLIIQDNTIGGAVTADYIGRYGMVLGNATGALVSKNTVRNHLFTAAGDGFGILLSTGFINSNVTRNSVSNLEASNTGGYGMTGIGIATATAASNLTVANNFIYDIRGTSWTTGVLADTVVGIRVSGTNTGGINVWHNSVNVFGNYAGASGSATITAALMITASTPTNLNVRDNIFVNTFDNTAGTGDKSYAIYTTSANTMFSAINYNDYFVSASAPGVLGAINSADAATLTALATATGGDANSISADPLYTSNTNLHLQMSPVASPAIDAGTPIGAVTVDFDGDTRPQGASSEIGADEIVVASAAGTIQFSSATYTVTEGTPTVTLTVTRAGGSSGAVTANYTLGGGTATGTAACGAAGEDYVNTGGSVSFADGDAADKTFTVAICNDAVYELSQTFDATLAIGAGTATLGTPNPATVTINNDDAAPTVGINDVSQAEGNAGTTNFGFGIAVTGASEVSAGLLVQTADGTATQPSDYSSVNTPIAVPADVNRTTTTYPGLVAAVNGDTNFEANETFFMNASGCTDCTISDNQGVATILNDDTQPTVQFSSATYTNGDDIAQNRGKDDELAPQVATITVTRTGAAGDAFAVNYATVAGGTATGGASCGTGSGVDYISTSGTLNFAAGETTKTFNVTVCTDNLFEGSETVNLALTSPSAPVILGTPATAVITITDNDPQPSLQFSSATYSNSDDVMKYGITTDEFAPQIATITVTRTGAVDNAVAVNYATSNGTATGGAACTTGVDYISTSGTLNFAAGVISQTFNVTVCTDALFEGNETVNLTLSNPTGGAALSTPNSAVLTIVDNDAQPSLQFSSATYSVGEAGPAATITVTRTGAADNAVSVNYATVAGGTATGGASCGGAVDYQNASGTLSFAAGETSKTFTVPICDDASAESSETVNLALSAPSGGAVLGTPNTAVLTITDNDTSPTLQFSAASVSVSEAAATVTLTVTRAGATGNAVSVNYATGGGTATAGACAPGVDYNAASGTLNFASGETSKTFSVTICNDAVYELNQTFDATLSNATGGATIGSPSVETVTITNDDAAPTIAIGDVSQAEGNAGTTNFGFGITVTGASEVGSGFLIATADGTATAPSDYTAINTTAVAAPADVNRTVTTYPGLVVSVNGDTTVEANETFFLNSSACTDCTITDNQAVGTILNDDTSVQFAQPLYTVSEGVGTVTLTVTRAGSSTGAISVNYAFAPITANGAASCGAGVDFAAVSGTLNWASGDSAPKTFNVTICEDALPESTESFISQLQSPTGGATIGAQSSTQVDITDNDSDTVAPVITYTPIPSNPGSTSLTATVTDAIGVTGVNIFWRINGGSFTSAPCSPAGGTPQNGTWTCIITGATNPSAVAYYVTATDGTNTTTNPGAGAGAPNLFTIGAATVPAGSYVNLNLGNGVSLGGDVIVNGSMTLSGIVNTGANKLTLGCGVAVIGGGEGSYVVGRLERIFCVNETFTFNVGAPFALPPVAPDGESLAPEGIVSNYSPVTVQITGGTVGSSLTVSATDQFLPGSRTDNSASRFWTLTETGNLTANLSFTYRNEDVNGDESIYNVLRRSGGVTMRFNSTNNPATNTATVNGISDFSDWAVGNLIPTAAGAEISGQLTTASGEGIRNATVMITGGNLTQPVYAQTGTFGYYKFSNLPVGQTYVVTVIAKRYTFADPTRVINLLENVTDENFVALEQ